MKRTSSPSALFSTSWNSIPNLVTVTTATTMEPWIGLFGRWTLLVFISGLAWTLIAKRTIQSFGDAMDWSGYLITAQRSALLAHRSTLAANFYWTSIWRSLGYTYIYIYLLYKCCQGDGGLIVTLTNFTYKHVKGCCIMKWQEHKNNNKINRNKGGLSLPSRRFYILASRTFT